MAVYHKPRYRLRPRVYAWAGGDIHKGPSVVTSVPSNAQCHNRLSYPTGASQHQAQIFGAVADVEPGDALSYEVAAARKNRGRGTKTRSKRILRHTAYRGCLHGQAGRTNGLSRRGDSNPQPAD